MEADVQILLSGALTFGVPLALAVRELLILRNLRGSDGRDDDPVPVAPSPTPGLEPRLPDCLIPKLDAPRVRVMERV